MKKRLIAFLLVLLLAVPALASAATYYRVTTGWLKVHILPSDDAQVLESFRKDFALTISDTAGDFSYVTFTNGTEGYVASKYLAKVKSYRAYITSDKTNLRSGPDYSFSDVAILGKGVRVTVLTHGEKYDYVSTAYGNGYVMNGFLSKKYVKPSKFKSYRVNVPKSDYDAWVTNSGTRKVNMRTRPDENAPVVNSYAPATPVYVIYSDSSWAHVIIDGEEGYMMTKFLTTYEPAPTPSTTTPPPVPDTPYYAYINTPDKKSVNVHKNAGLGYANVFRAEYATRVKVLEHGKTWDKIKQNGKTGWVLNKYLTLVQPDPTPSPTPKPTAKPTPTPFVRYNTTVTCPEGEKVNIRKGPGQGYTHVARLDPGTEVRVLEFTSASWAKVRYEGITGYVMRKFLVEKK